MERNVDLPEDEEQQLQEMFEHFRLVVDPGQEPMRIDRFMASHLENSSRNRIQQAIKGEDRKGQLYSTPRRCNPLYDALRKARVRGASGGYSA